MYKNKNKNIEDLLEKFKKKSLLKLVKLSCFFFFTNPADSINM